MCVLVGLCTPALGWQFGRWVASPAAFGQGRHDGWEEEDEEGVVMVMGIGEEEEGYRASERSWRYATADDRGLSSPGVSA